MNKNSLTARGSLLVVLMLALLGPAISVQAQSTEAAHQQFLFAYKLLQRGENRLAADAFGEYLGGFPDADKRGDATYYLALLDRRLGKNQQAADLLDGDVPAPKLVPAYALKLLQGQILCDLKRYAPAIAALEGIDPEPLKPATSASVYFLRGLAYRGAGNLDAAAAALKQAVGVDSSLKNRARLDLARVQALQKHPGQAIKTLGPVIDAGGAASAEAARLAGDLSYQQQQYTQAIELYHHVLSSRQSSPQFGPSVVGTLWAQFSAGRYQALLDTFNQYLSSLPERDRVRASYLAGSAHQKLGQHQDAAQVLQRIAQGRDKYPLLEKVLYKLAVSRYELGQYDLMRQTVDRLGRQFPKSSFRVDAAFLEATAQAKQGNVTQGAASLTELIDQPGNPYRGQALLQRARLYENNDHAEDAADDYAAYLEQAGLDTADSRQAALRLIDLDYRTGQPARGLAMAQRMLRRDDLEPDTRQEALFRLGLTQIKLEKPKDALASLDQLQSDFPLNPYRDRVTYYRGLIQMSQDQTDQAIALLSKAAESDKLDQPLRINALHLTALQQRDEQPDRAQQTLRRLQALAGVDALTDREKLFMGRRMLDSDQPGQAMVYLQPITATRGATPTIAHAAYLSGKAQRALKKYEPAERSLRRVVAMGKGYDLRARLELAQVRADRGEIRAGIDEMRDLISSESSDIAARALFESGMLYRRLARQQTQHDQADAATDSNEQARKLLKRLVLLYPGPELAPLPQRAHIELAEIAAQLGEEDQAVGELDELIDKYPDSPYAIYARAVLAEGQQRLGKAKALLQSLEDKPMDPELASWVTAKLRSLESQS